MRFSKSSTSLVIAYGLFLAGAAFLLQWLDYLHTIRRFATETYLLLIASGFTALGIWAGSKLTPVSRRESFARNDKAIAALGITRRELDVLMQLAPGRANDEIASALHVSPNTVKTHLGRLYGKLDVSRRTQAINKARSLGLIE